ncbi:MAG TPA: ZIP family metal transporter [candidate division Zixibacteria bacterium]|jgi:zinc transporter ZupT
MSEMPVSVLTVFAVAMLTALATGLGAMPFLFFPTVSRRWLSISNAVAAGLMLAASHSLIVEGNHYSLYKTLIGILIGMAVIAVSDRILEKRKDLHIGRLSGADGRKAILILGVMTMHSFAEGVGVGVSFGGTEALGIMISLVIAIHNIPEGLAISLVMVPRGTTIWKAAWWSVFSSLPQPLMAVPAYLFVSIFEPFLPIGLGIAGGAMIWMVFAELIPDALRDASGHLVATTVTISVVVMLAAQAMFFNL